MQTKRKQQTKRHPRSVGNLALADESRGVLQKLEAESQAPRLRLVQNIAEEYLKVDDSAQAKRIVAGIGLSIVLCVLWFLIVLVMYRLLKPLIM
jgi:hypothetical protein